MNPMRLLLFPLILLSQVAYANELGDLLRIVLLQPQIRAASGQGDATTGPYPSSADLSASGHEYVHKPVVSALSPIPAEVGPASNRITKIGVDYALPVDLFGVIAASRERAGKDLAASELLLRQQALLRLHQTSNAYFTLQALQQQREALAVAKKRVAATVMRVKRAIELGNAPGSDARSVGSELARLEADQAKFDEAIRRAQTDLDETSGRKGFQPAATVTAIPAWEASIEETLPTRIAQAREDAARARAEESRRALKPSLTVEAGYAHNLGAGDNRDIWALGGVVNIPLGGSSKREADAQRLKAEEAREQSEAARREGVRQLAALHAAFDAALADALALEQGTVDREQVIRLLTGVKRLDGRKLKKLLRNERDLLDTRYRLVQAYARAAVTWSSAEVLVGMAPETYIARWDATP